MTNFVFTIGHSNHSLEAFLGLLSANQVNAIADVRSSPSSRIHPQFNKACLIAPLRNAGMSYVFLGDQLGGRPADNSCYTNGRVSYELLSQTLDFSDGLDRLVDGSRRHRIAVLCAEKDPLMCHRGILIARCLEARGVDTMHIHPDGSVESHGDASARLLGELGMAEGDLFRSDDEQMSEAYTRRADQIAYAL